VLYCFPHESRPRAARSAEISAERCWSGRTGLPAKQFHPKRVTGVRIPPSPPVFFLSRIDLECTNGITPNSGWARPYEVTTPEAIHARCRAEIAFRFRQGSWKFLNSSEMKQRLINLSDNLGSFGILGNQQTNGCMIFPDSGSLCPTLIAKDFWQGIRRNQGHEVQG
jgi:hypothetical protein